MTNTSLPMTDPIIVKRLLRSLRYRKTYAVIWAAYREASPDPRLGTLLDSLLEAERESVSCLSNYLKEIGIRTGSIQLNQQLLADATRRDDTESRLWFIQYALTKTTAWCRIQLVDDRMTAEEDVTECLLDLGELQAARLWHTEMVMAGFGLLEISETGDSPAGPKVSRKDVWRPRLTERFGDQKGPATGTSGRSWPDRPRRQQRRRPDTK